VGAISNREELDGLPFKIVVTPLEKQWDASKNHSHQPVTLPKNCIRFSEVSYEVSDFWCMELVLVHKL